MKLGKKQRIFTKMVSELIDYAYGLGYEIAFAEGTIKKNRKVRIGGAVVRHEDAEHHPNSNHYRKLAVDLDLFRDDNYLKKSEDHYELGLYWIMLGEKYNVPAVWGGDWGDGNHYSIEHNGMK